MKFKIALLMTLLTVASATSAGSLQGVWWEGADGYTRCYPAVASMGTNAIHPAYCGRLEGVWWSDINGYTQCFRRGSADGAKAIHRAYCGSEVKGAWSED